MLQLRQEQLTPKLMLLLLLLLLVLLLMMLRLLQLLLLLLHSQALCPGISVKSGDFTQRRLLVLLDCCRVFFLPTRAL